MIEKINLFLDFFYKKNIGISHAIGYDLFILEDGDKPLIYCKIKTSKNFDISFPIENSNGIYCDFSKL